LARREIEDEQTVAVVAMRHIDNSRHSTRGFSHPPPNYPLIAEARTADCFDWITTAGSSLATHEVFTIRMKKPPGLPVAIGPLRHFSPRSSTTRTKKGS
jgi:hypothetical protein